MSKKVTKKAESRIVNVVHFVDVVKEIESIKDPNDGSIYKLIIGNVEGSEEMFLISELGSKQLVQKYSQDEWNILKNEINPPN